MSGLELIPIIGSLASAAGATGATAGATGAAAGAAGAAGAAASGGLSLGSVLGGLGTATGIAGSILGAEQQRSAAKFEAAEMEKRANAEMAASQRDAAAKRREGELLMSRQQALAGGASSDPSLIALMGDAGAEAEYNAQTALYRGSDAASTLRSRAAAKRTEASTYMPAALIRSSTSLLADYGRARTKG